MQLRSDFMDAEGFIGHTKSVFGLDVLWFFFFKDIIPFKYKLHLQKLKIYAFHASPIKKN
jgi:hypothetical protein